MNSFTLTSTLPIFFPNLPSAESFHFPPLPFLNAFLLVARSPFRSPHSSSSAFSSGSSSESTTDRFWTLETGLLGKEWKFELFRVGALGRAGMTVEGREEESLMGR
jgi:hypothetical protein